MFALMLLGFVASASTTPWYDPHEYKREFQDSMDRFWNNFDRKMDDLDKKMEKLTKHSKNRESSKIDGKEYKITITMTGFNKKDISVQAKKGNVVIQAIHNVPGEPSNNYQHEQDLPDFVDENGSWSYNNDVLTIVFPVIPKSKQENYRIKSLDKPKFYHQLPEKTN